MVLHLEYLCLFPMFKLEIKFRISFNILTALGGASCTQCRFGYMTSIHHPFLRKWSIFLFESFWIFLFDLPLLLVSKCACMCFLTRIIPSALQNLGNSQPMFLQLFLLLLMFLFPGIFILKRLIFFPPFRSSSYVIMLSLYFSWVLSRKSDISDQ